MSAPTLPQGGPPPETETAAPTGIGSGGKITKAAGLRSEEYSQSDLAAITKWKAAFARILVACRAFNELEAEEQRIFAERLHDLMQAGEPIPPFDDVMAEARDWASWASGAELRAYAVACWEQFADHQRQRFLAWALRPSNGREAAA